MHRSGALILQLQRWLEPLLQPWWPQIQTAGHRLEQLEALNPLAPLHNPPALEAIRWLQAWRQIAADEAGIIARLVSRADPAFGAAAG